MTIKAPTEHLVKPRLDLLIVLVIAVALLGLAYWLPLHQADLATKGLIDTNCKEYFEIANKARSTLLQGFTGASFFVTAFVALRNLRVAEDNRKIAQNRQATDLFVKAAEMLGNEKSLEVRLAGIYSLERIARDFPDDHWTVMEVLITFIQNKSSVEPLKKVQLHSPSHILTPDRMTIIDRAAQVALTVLGRRAVENDNGLRLVLDGVDLSFARLDETANLDNASLCFVSLSSARVEGSSLSGIMCAKSGLQHARFDEVDLRKSDLSSSGLSGAIFLHTDLRDVVLDNADICATDFRTSSKWLTPEQVKAAKNWQYALYDPEFVIKLAKHSPHDQKFVEQLEDLALENPEFTKELAKYDPEFAKQLGLSPQDTQDQSNEPGTSSDTSG